MEGLFNPFQFSFPKSINQDLVLKSIVKIRPKRTLEFSFFETNEMADRFSETRIDESGFETIQCGFVESDRLKCSNPEFSQALFTHEFCELIKSGSIFPTKTPLLGHGTGVVVSKDGYIATNFHLVSGAVEHLGKLDGYFGTKNYLIKNIEVEIPTQMLGGEIKYRKATEVFLAGTYSRTDAFKNRLDLAILKINELTPDFLPITKSIPTESYSIYSIGFSMRTARNEERKKLLGYQDACYDLRVSSGQIVRLDGENSFLADTDGAPGDSGSAAINDNGELVGIYSGSTGNGIVDPSKSFRRYVHSKFLMQLFENKI
jgi:hypothetical protein